MSTVRVEFNLGSAITLAVAEDRYIRDDGNNTMQMLRELLDGVEGGAVNAAVLAQTCGDTFATTTITCVYANVIDGTDDITIGPVTLSVEASPSGENQFDGGSSDATCAANVTAAINAHSVLKNLVFASDDGVDTVTVTSRLAGQIGNCIALAETGTGFTLGAAALAGGTENDAVEYTRGVAAVVG